METRIINGSSADSVTLAADLVNKIALAVTSPPCFEQYASGNALLRHAREAINASPEIARNLLSRGDGTVAGRLVRFC